MVHFKLYRKVALTGILAIFLVSCGGGTIGGERSGSSDSLLFDGWNSYKNGVFEKAEQQFKDAVTLDPNVSEAYNGLAWLNFEKAGQVNEEQRPEILNEAKLNFQKATAADPKNVDAWVGLAGLELEKGNWKGVRDAANQALELDPFYFSSHDNIDFKDVHLLLAQAFFYLGAFVNSEANPDPNNSLYHLEILSPGYKNFYHENKKSPPDLIRKIGELQGI